MYHYSSVKDLQSAPLHLWKHFLYDSYIERFVREISVAAFCFSGGDGVSEDSACSSGSILTVVCRLSSQSNQRFA